MVAQIRAKQKATKSSQDKVQKIVVEYCEQHPDTSDAQLVRRFIENMETFYDTSVSINNYLKDQNAHNIGYPIKTNKTHLQLDMAKKWLENQGEEIISQIQTGKFHRKLSNTTAVDELPALQSPSNQAYWGNENPSVTSVLLASIAAICDQRQDTMPGAATFFPFYNSNFKFPDELIPFTYPFASTKGMILFGDYQYGGHSYFQEQLIFGPEDCSSSIGKTSNFTAKQIKDISTDEMIEAYSMPENEYRYRAITFLNGDINDEQLKLIEAGDIFLIKGHTALIATKPDNKGNVMTVEFRRNIDLMENKVLGGGVYEYNLCNIAKATGIYILRPNSESIHESCSLRQLLHRIDAKYSTLFPDGVTDIAGDCRIFLQTDSLTGDIL